MPNFKCEFIRNFSLPFEKNGVRFLGFGLGFCEVNSSENLGEKTAKNSNENLTNFGKSSIQNSNENSSVLESKNSVLKSKFLAKNLPQNQSANSVNLSANSRNFFDFDDLKEGQICLILAHFKGAEFFLQISKKTIKNSQNFTQKNEFLIKGEKHSKPQMVGLLQATLIVFKESFCEKIINEAIKLKPTRLLEQSPLIAQNTGVLLERAARFDGVKIEIGFGSGRHLLFLAQNAPNALVIGIETYLPAIEQVAKLAQSAKLNNILLIKDDARLVFSALVRGFASEIYLHFPVPWDKQENRRVLNAHFADEILRVLGENGCFHLRTDSQNYYDFALFLFENCQKNAPKSIEITSAKNENLSINSKYEARWKRQNKDIFDLRVLKNFSKNHNEINEKTGENSQILGQKKCLKNENLSTENRDFAEFDLSNFALNSRQKENLLKNFKKLRFKGDDFFIHLENLYRFFGENFSENDKNLNSLKNDFTSENLQKNSQNYRNENGESLILQVNFGAFNQSEHHFLLLNKESKFLFKSPFKTKENLKAFSKLSELFKGFLQN